MDEVEEEAREEEKMETIQGEDAGGDEGENDTTLASEVSRLPSPLLFLLSQDVTAATIDSTPTGDETLANLEET